MNAKQPNRHQRRKQRTREKLQEAMLDLMLEKGIKSIAIQEITDRADLGRGTFYFHFDDKEDLLWSIVEDRIHATENQLMQEYDGSMPEQAEFYAYHNMFRHVEENREVYQLLLGNKGSQDVANRAKQYLVSETIRDIDQFGVFQDIGQPPEITAHIVVGLLFSLIFWWLESPSKYTVGEMAGILYKTLHHQDPP
ncbi:MAG: TetR/AcrR family transcriptional regulator [Anaerolineales bacterium]|jgi:AcrR family transcriptional regulator